MESSRTFSRRRRPLIVGNWKMNGLIESAVDMGEALRQGFDERNTSCEVVVCPPFTALHALHQQLGESSVKLGAQNVFCEEFGPYTGEICGIMLRNVGCRYVILGHSERRTLFGENHSLIVRKTMSSFRDGLQPIVCIGESLEQREKGETLVVLQEQLLPVLKALADQRERWVQLVVAYEPVWAIGTGKVASTDQIQEVHYYLRGLLKEHFDEDASQRVRILYGGSVKPDNAAAIFALPDVDGGLIGSASLQSKEFLAIIDALPAVD
ncbi:MAG: triose-phosphate isomerase [Magnetococcales bacterium]|nr:triose-phosphate isomerase [Magnetococcales bacterium]NGZ26371.1 triose-phosphate isomerase [Magnetococcales bacterium]